MFAKLLRFNVGFGRPELAQRIAAATEATMSGHPGYRMMILLADYLGGRYTLVTFWDSDRHLYDFSYSADARRLEGTIEEWLSGVPFVGTYQVYVPDPSRGVLPLGGDEEAAGVEARARFADRPIPAPRVP